MNAPSSVFEHSGVKYYADPLATPKQLMSGATLLLDAVAATVSTLAAGLDDEDGDMAVNPKISAAILWGVLHQVRMASGMTEEASTRTPRG
tara:strand:+ start:139 stop:411 length:273 start_codon:yes stop_codon:yes gene_type:complete